MQLLISNMQGRIAYREWEKSKAMKRISSSNNLTEFLIVESASSDLFITTRWEEISFNLISL